MNVSRILDIHTCIPQVKRCDFTMFFSKNVMLEFGVPAIKIIPLFSIYPISHPLEIEKYIYLHEWLFFFMVFM